MTPRKGNKRFENKVVKSLTIECDEKLTDMIYPFNGMYVQIEYIGNYLDEIDVESICCAIRISIMNVITFDRRGQTISCSFIFSTIFPDSNDICNIFPHINDENGKNINILFVYYISNDNDEKVKITKAIQLRVE